MDATVPEDDGWSAVAAEWSRLWGSVSDPVRERLIAEAGIGRGSRVLDVGCGSGEFIRMLASRGAYAVGVDPAPGMVALAGAWARLTDAEHLPWPDATFDVVTAVNALQFVDDLDAALAEARRVLVPGGLIAVANWAEDDRNDLAVLERAVARYHGDEVAAGELRDEGALESLMLGAGLEVVATGTVDVPWVVDGGDDLARGVLLGEDDATIAAIAPHVLVAADPFRVGTGYRLENVFRFVVARAR